MGRRAGVDAPDVELPVAGKAGARDGNAIADLEPEAVRGGLADDRALLVGEEGRPLVVGHQELGVEDPIGLVVDGELGKEVLLVLVDPAEPVGVGDLLHPRRPLDPVLVGQGQGLDQRHLVDDEQPVRPRHVHPRVEGGADGDEDAEQEQRHRERAHGEDRAHLAAQEVREQQGQELHRSAREDALVQVQRRVGALRRLGVVGDHEDRLLQVGGQLLQEQPGSRPRCGGRGRRWARRRGGTTGRPRWRARWPRAAAGRRTAPAACAPRGRRCPRCRGRSGPGACAPPATAGPAAAAARRCGRPRAPGSGCTSGR